MTAPGLVISTDTSTCVSISLILPHKMRSLYWLPNTISRDSIWKLTSHLNTRSLVNLGISFENRCPPPAEAQFPTHILTLSRMRGKLGKAWATSPQHRHRRTNRRRNSHKCSATCCWLCFCQFLKFEQNESIGCFSDVAQYYNSEVINITHIRKQEYVCIYGVWVTKTRPWRDPDARLDLISFSITRPILEVVNDQEAGPAIREAVRKLIKFRT